MIYKKINTAQKGQPLQINTLDKDREKQFQFFPEQSSDRKH